MSKWTAQLLMLLFFPGWRTASAQANYTWISGLAEDYKTHQPLSATWRWTDSTHKTVLERTTHSDGFAGWLSSEIRFLTITSPGYRNLQLPIHWPALPSDSLSFRVRIPLIPIDRPTVNQPYFQSEQRPLQLARSRADSSDSLVKFSIVDVLTNRPVRAKVCLFFTKRHRQTCYTASTLELKVQQSDIVAFEVRAVGYQSYLGNLVITEPTDLYTIRLSSTPTILTVSAPEMSTGLQLMRIRSRTVSNLVVVDHSHFFISTIPGMYQLIGRTKNQPVMDTIHLTEGLNAYAIPQARTAVNTAQEMTIYFVQSRYELNDSSRRQLDKVVFLMQQNPVYKLRITGHTDNVGDPELNRTLAEFRAKVTKNYLLHRGIQESRLSLKAAGSDQPIVSNDTEENRKKNRRVSLYIQ